MEKILVFLFFLSSQSLSGQPCPAFPGAMGHGASTQGGRGGKILYVTNLNDAGPGSLRAACLEKGSRIVIFKIGGLIQLKNDVIIDNPNITIAGQTAPGNGVLITGAGIRLRTSEIIMRGLRVRPGYDAGKDKDALSIVPKSEPIVNIIIDHCSFSWARDENIGLNAGRKKIRNVTIQNCIIAEGLKGHSMGLLVNKKLDGEGVDSLTIIQNLFAHNSERNPMIGSGGGAEVINNVIYNWQYKASAYHSDSRANIIGNFWKAGMSTKGIHRAIEAVQSPLLYLNGNIGPNRKSTDSPESEMVNGDKSMIKNDQVIPSTLKDYLTAFEARDFVLLNAGSLPRDSTDTRIVESVLKGFGDLIEHERDVEGVDHFQTPVFNERNYTNVESSQTIKLDDQGICFTEIEMYINHFFLEIISN